MDAFGIAHESHHGMGSAKPHATAASLFRAATATSNQHAHHWTGGLSFVCRDRCGLECVCQRYNLLVDNRNLCWLRAHSAADYRRLLCRTTRGLRRRSALGRSEERPLQPRHEMVSHRIAVWRGGPSIRHVDGTAGLCDATSRACAVGRDRSGDPIDFAGYS
jgi:hypothetical protein